MASRVTRVSPWLEPSACGGTKRSKPITRAPRLANCNAAALPMAPRPTIATSYLSISLIRLMLHAMRSCSDAQCITFWATGWRPESGIDRLVCTQLHLFPAEEDRQQHHRRSAETKLGQGGYFQTH